MCQKISIICLLILAVNLSYSQKKVSKKFSLECQILNDYSGYIYLEYGNKLDSCLITNNHFSFKGKLDKEIVGAVLILKGKSTNSPDLYLENSHIEIELKIEEQNRKDQVLTFLTITSAKGTKTSKIQNDFAEFQKAHKSDKDYMQKWCDKVEDIVTKNPKNPFGSSLLCGLS
jgi:hypothetical protein